MAIIATATIKRIRNTNKRKHLEDSPNTLSKGEQVFSLLQEIKTQVLKKPREDTLFGTPENRPKPTYTPEAPSKTSSTMYSPHFRLDLEPGSCFHCGQKGHMWRRCSMRPEGMKYTLKPRGGGRSPVAVQQGPKYLEKSSGGPPVVHMMAQVHVVEAGKKVAKKLKTLNYGKSMYHTWLRS